MKAVGLGVVAAALTLGIASCGVASPTQTARPELRVGSSTGHATAFRHPANPVTADPSPGAQPTAAPTVSPRTTPTPVPAAGSGGGGGERPTPTPTAAPTPFQPTQLEATITNSGATIRATGWMSGPTTWNYGLTIPMSNTGGLGGVTISAAARWQWTSTPGMHMSISAPVTLDCSGAAPQPLGTASASVDSGQGYMSTSASLSSMGSAGCTSGGTASIQVTVTLANGL